MSQNPPARDRRLGLTTVYAIWLFGIVSYFVPAATWSPVSRFNVARALVETHTLAIDPFATSTGDRAHVGAHWYSDKAPIVGLMAAIPYAGYYLFDRARGGEPRYTAVGSEDFPARRVYVNTSFQRGLYVASAATAGAAGVAFGVLLFLLLRRRTTPRTALLASAATVLSTPIFPYATSLYGHVIAGAFFLAAVVIADTVTAAPPSAWPPRRLRLAGAALALAAGSEYIVAVPSAIVGLWLLLRARGSRWSTAGQLALGAAGPVLLVCVYHTICFGAPWRTPYSFIDRPQFAAGHASGFFGIHLPAKEAMWGLLVGPRRGLLYVAPVAAVGLIGAVATAYERRDSVARVLLLAAAALLLINAGYYMWWGGAAAGPRHLVPALAFVAFGVGWACSRKRFCTLTALLAAVSLANMLALTAVGLEAPEAGNILTDYAYPQLIRGKVAHMNGASNLGIEIGLAPAASLGPLLAWMVVGFRVLMRRAGEEPASQTGLLAPSGLTIVAGLLAAGCVDQQDQAPPPQPSTVRAAQKTGFAPTPSARGPLAPPADRNDLTAATYPNGNALVARVEDCALAMLGPGAEEHWVRRAGSDCGGILQIAVAQNSQAFARTATELRAFAPNGDPIWTAAVDRVPPSLAAPAVAPDSSVIVVGSSRTALAFNPDGERIWTFKIDGDEKIIASPVGRPTEGVLVFTTAAVYALAPDGTVRWRSPFGGATE